MTVIEKLKIATFDFEKTIAMLRSDFEKVGESDALDEVKDIYRGILYFALLNLYALGKELGQKPDASLETWLEEGKGQHKKAHVESLAIFRTNLLPESDYEKVVERLKDCYLELTGTEEEDEVRELKKKLVLTLISLNFTLYFEGGEEAYSEAQEWLMEREFGNISD